MTMLLVGFYTESYYLFFRFKLTNLSNLQTTTTDVLSAQGNIAF